MYNLQTVLFRTVDNIGHFVYQVCSVFTSAWSPMWTSTCAHTSSILADTLNMSTGDKSESLKNKKRMKEAYNETFILCILCVCVRWKQVKYCVCLLPGSLQSFRLRLKDLVRDMLIGCLSEGPKREDRPEGWEVEEVGPEPGRWDWLPIFKWSFSAFRVSTVDWDAGKWKKTL